ncbi:MAG TPA: hypothetical protein VGM88_35380 [Kofleriaceae bacterium]
MERTAMRRVFLIGDARAIASDPDGPKAITAYSDLSNSDVPEVVTADPHPVPPNACGERLGQQFLDQTLAHFHILATNQCRISNTHVDCPTYYLPGPYTRTFITLIYINDRAQLSRLEIKVVQRGKSGRISPVMLEAQDRDWYNELFKQLRELSYCR